MGERRFKVRSRYDAALAWPAIAGAAPADPLTRESWPAVNTHYRESNLVLVSRHPERP
jgi:hypothetical protein